METSGGQLLGTSSDRSLSETGAAGRNLYLLCILQVAFNSRCLRDLMGCPHAFWACLLLCQPLFPLPTCKLGLANGLQQRNIPT